MLTSKRNLKEIYKTLFLRFQRCLFTSTHIIHECGGGGYFLTLFVCRLCNVERGNRNKRGILANTYYEFMHIFTSCLTCIMICILRFLEIV
jgi:hypothetical protein